MTIQQAIETVRIALGNRNEHHPICDSKILKRAPCDCYARQRQSPHEAMDEIEKFVAAYMQLLKEDDKEVHVVEMRLPEAK